MRMSCSTSSHDAAAGEVRLRVAARIDRRNRRVVRAASARAPPPSLAIVDAVPMTLQVPVDRDMHDSACMNSFRLIVPALTSSLNRQTSVPDPIGLPRYLPFSIGPPETTSAGRSQLAAPMTSAGVVLSQPQSSTTPSMRVRRESTPRRPCSRDCGRASPSGAGSSRRATSPGTRTAGRPLPRRRASRARRARGSAALHGVSSDHVLQIPMIGRPSKIPSGSPRPTQLRWMKPSLSSFAEPGRGSVRAFESDIKSSSRIRSPGSGSVYR